MTTADRRHLREAERIVRTIIKHEQGIDVDGSVRKTEPALATAVDQAARIIAYEEATRVNWRRIRVMLDIWQLEEK